MAGTWHGHDNGVDISHLRLTSEMLGKLKAIRTTFLKSWISGFTCGFIVYWVVLRRRGFRRKKRTISQDGKKRVLVVCTGSVAAVKVHALVFSLIKDYGFFIDLVFTHTGFFFQGVSYQGTHGWRMLSQLTSLRSSDGTSMLEIWNDDDEWNNYKSLGDPVIHIELARRNCCLLVAPLSANSMAAFVNGSSGSLSSSIFRAWHYDLDVSTLATTGTCIRNKPVIVAPSMNTIMWHQNITSRQLDILRNRGVFIIEPIVKTLACGDTGKGAMAEVSVIAKETAALIDK